MLEMRQNMKQTLETFSPKIAGLLEDCDMHSRHSENKSVIPTWGITSTISSYFNDDSQQITKKLER